METTTTTTTILEMPPAQKTIQERIDLRMIARDERIEKILQDREKNLNKLA